MAHEADPEVMYKLGRIESSVESIAAELKRITDDIKTRQENHEKRLSDLEKREIKYVTISTVIGGVGAFILNLAVNVWLKLH